MDTMQARQVDDDGTLALAGGTITDIDEAERSAEFVVSTTDEDREGDILISTGCRPWLDEYKANPVVLFEHDAKLGPVGTCTDSRGRFHFEIKSDSIVSRVFFHCKPFMGRNLSRECWDLVKCGALRGASPGFLPMEAENRGYGRGAGKKYTGWRLTEWSLTAQPVNQSALKRALDSGVVNKSMTLYPYLEKLSMYATDEDEKLLSPEDAAALCEHCEGALAVLPRMMREDDSDVLRKLHDACEDVCSYYGTVHEQLAIGADVDETKCLARLKVIAKNLDRAASLTY